MKVYLNWLCTSVKLIRTSNGNVTNWKDLLITSVTRYNHPSAHTHASYYMNEACIHQSAYEVEGENIRMLISRALERQTKRTRSQS